MNKRVSLVADGAPLLSLQLRALLRGRFVVALDGAADQAKRQKWRPNRITGDFDSISLSTLAYFDRLGVEIIPTPDQNHTDLEKALALSVHDGATSIWIAQALGLRLDHTLANLSFLKKFHHAHREILVFTATEKIRFARDEKLTLRGKKGRAFAVFPFPHCTATSKGLAYELDGHKLELGKSESVSNRAAKAAVDLRIKGEALVIEEA
jgi:thiamine pyrophosphokinase